MSQARKRSWESQSHDEDSKAAEDDCLAGTQGNAHINKFDKNYNDVIRRNGPMLRKKFKKHAEALLLMRVPDAYRVQARHDGLWLQERLVGDSTGESALRLEDNDIGILRKSITEETLECQLNICIKKVNRILKTKEFNVDDLRTAKAALAEVEMRKRNYEAKRTDRSEEEFSKYLENCSAMIGYLQDMCSPLLIEELEANEEYNNAIDKGDIVRAGYITRAFVMDIDTKNVKRERQKRLTELLSFRMRAGDKFGTYADKFLKKYKEYKSMCDGGRVSDDNEDSLVQALIGHTMHKFAELTKLWMADRDETNRPTTVKELLEVLLTYDRRIEYSESLHRDEESGKRQKSEKTTEVSESSELVKVMKSLATTFSNFKPNLSEPQANSNFKSRKMCNYFRREGGCKNGDKCRFQHFNIDSNLKEKTNSESHCNNIIKYGKCSAGSRCPNFSLHEFTYQEIINGNVSKGTTSFST